ncbi:hypothetical protein GA0074694_4427 [Micromonospora inyonensis]|uniref:Uncharacterized protein n=1 Tax=Micromonospora inyonensis TaxID=47866 RepID=A0A1C6S9Q4_9ACTN|nr:hypothetical protein GA0074694_4427 [Micromonospora inyonensis]
MTDTTTVLRRSCLGKAEREVADLCPHSGR